MGLLRRPLSIRAGVVLQLALVATASLALLAVFALKVIEVTMQRRNVEAGISVAGVVRRAVEKESCGEPGVPESHRRDFLRFPLPLHQRSRPAAGTAARWPPEGHSRWGEGVPVPAGVSHRGRDPPVRSALPAHHIRCRFRPPRHPGPLPFPGDRRRGRDLRERHAAAGRDRHRRHRPFRGDLSRPDRDLPRPQARVRRREGRGGGLLAAGRRRRGERGGAARRLLQPDGRGDSGGAGTAAPLREGDVPVREARDRGAACGRGRPRGGESADGDPRVRGAPAEASAGYRGVEGVPR